MEYNAERKRVLKQATRMKLEDILLREMSQSHTVLYYSTYMM